MEKSFSGTNERDREKLPNIIVPRIKKSAMLFFTYRISLPIKMRQPKNLISRGFALCSVTFFYYFPPECVFMKSRPFSQSNA